MIRFIRIGDQIGCTPPGMEPDDHFAFWDTVPDSFVEIYDKTVFDSIEDLVECLRLDEASNDWRERLLRHAYAALPPLREKRPEGG